MKGTIRDRVIRKARRDSITARTFLTVDFAAIERRFMEAPVEDLHKEAAAIALGIPVADVTHEQRKFGKAINFYRMYGGEDLPSFIRPPRRKEERNEQHRSHDNGRQVETRPDVQRLTGKR